MFSRNLPTERFFQKNFSWFVGVCVRVHALIRFVGIQGAGRQLLPTARPSRPAIHPEHSMGKQQYSQRRFRSETRANYYPPNRVSAADGPKYGGSVCLTRVYFSRVTHAYSRATSWLSAFPGLLIRKGASHISQWR